MNQRTREAHLGIHWADTGVSSFDVTSDGRFLMVPEPRPEQTATQLNIVLNWLRELQERVPVK